MELAVINHAIAFPAHRQYRANIIFKRRASGCTGKEKNRKLGHCSQMASVMRFHKTILQEFYQVTFRKKLYSDIEMLQNDLDAWIAFYNNKRTHQGKICCGGNFPSDTY